MESTRYSVCVLCGIFLIGLFMAMLENRFDYVALLTSGAVVGFFIASGLNEMEKK